MFLSAGPVVRSLVYQNLVIAEQLTVPSLAWVTVWVYTTLVTQTHVYTSLMKLSRVRCQAEF